MALRMAASFWSAPVLLLFLFVCPVFTYEQARWSSSVSTAFEQRCRANLCSPYEDFSNSAALFFTYIWLSEAIPDSVSHLPGFQLDRSVVRAASGPPTFRSVTQSVNHQGHHCPTSDSQTRMIPQIARISPVHTSRNQ